MMHISQAPKAGQGMSQEPWDAGGQIDGRWEWDIVYSACLFLELNSAKCPWAQAGSTGSLGVIQGAGEGIKAQAEGCKPLLRRGLIWQQEMDGADPLPLTGSS